MKISELYAHRTDKQSLEEIAPLVSIANWFGQKFHDVVATGSTKLGQGEVQRFINKHLRAFMQVMGRYKQDWPTVTMNVVYNYMRLVMKLNDVDILKIVNDIMKDPTVRGKRMTIQQIKDINKKLVVSSIGTSIAAANGAQILIEKLITAAATKQMELHWEEQSGVDTATQQQKQAPRGGASTSGQTTTTTTQSSPQTAASLTSVTVPTISSALSQVGALP